MNLTLQGIRNCASLGNLKKAKPIGQVATLLILAITTILIFTLVVMNIGQISNYATNLSNAVDSGSLYLASQLGTKSYQLSMSLVKSCGNPVKCCVKKGFLSTLLSIVVAIIAIIVTICTFGGTAPFTAAFFSTLSSMLTTTTGVTAIIAAGTIGGAIGGGIGGAIQGTGWLQGALQGAMIGGAIGFGVVGGASVIGGTTAAAEASAATFAATGCENLAGMAYFTTLGTYGAIGAALGVTVVAGASIYSEYAQQAMLADAMAHAAKALSGLPEKERYRESVFLQVLSQTVDDPNRVIDYNDSDGDDDYTEYVPAFQVWWENRIQVLKGEIKVDLSEAERIVKNFLKGPNSAVGRFLTAINKFQSQFNGNTGDTWGVFSALEDAGYDVPFWAPGPDDFTEKRWKKQVEDCMKIHQECIQKQQKGEVCTQDCDPDKIPNPSGYDEIDYLDSEFKDFKEEVSELREYLVSDKKIEELLRNWKSLLMGFFDPEDTDEGDCTDCSRGDWYTVLDNIINGNSMENPPLLGLNNWIARLEQIRRERLPDCRWGFWEYYYDYDYGYYVCNECNPRRRDLIPTCGECLAYNTPLPCKGPLDLYPDFGTINLDLENEFNYVYNAINEFIPAIREFREASVKFYNDLKSALDKLPTGWSMSDVGGNNPVTYEWKDSRGDHSVRVHVGDFKIPRIIRKKSGGWWRKKICLILIHHTQDLTVTVTRKDPANKAVGLAGLLGKWNPYYGGEIRRKSTARIKGLAGGAGNIRLVGK